MQAARGKRGSDLLFYSDVWNNSNYGTSLEEFWETNTENI